MDKPQKQMREYYEFLPVMHWLEKKYDFRMHRVVDEAGKNRDFWSFCIVCIDRLDAKQETFISIKYEMIDLVDGEDWYEYPEWAKKIIRLILDEFGEGDYWVWR